MPYPDLFQHFFLNQRNNKRLLTNFFFIQVRTEAEKVYISFYASDFKDSPTKYGVFINL